MWQMYILDDSSVGIVERLLVQAALALGDDHSAEHYQFANG